MLDPQDMPTPKIEGETTEDSVGALFDEWWTEVGLESFVEFCQKKGLPVLDDSNTEAQICEEKALHDKFFESNA